jgi:predicted acetyltransferase
MADLETRLMRDGELRAYLTAVTRSFGEAMTDDDYTSSERVFEPDRVFVAADGDNIVGGGAAFSFRLTVPGGAEIGAAAVTAVGTLPTHRRRGALTQVMRQLLDQARTREEPVAILWASEGSIYQRFGYGMGTLQAEFEILQARASFRDQVAPVGSMRIVEADEAKRLFPPIFDRVRARTPGFCSRTATWWEEQIFADPERWRRGAGPKTFVVHEVDGRPEGYLIFRVKNEWESGASKSALLVRELIADTPRAGRELWRFCFGHDLIHTVRAGNLAPDHPLLLMLNEPRRLRFLLGEQLWLRVVDVAAALRARSFDSADRIVLDMTDTYTPDLAGRWLVDTTGDSPVIERTDAAPDLGLDVTDLACLYLGAFTTTEMAEAGRTVELTDGARARVDALFQVARKPWCPTDF